MIGDELAFDEFNSWGLRTGDQGYAWLTWRRHFASTVRYHRFNVCRTTTDDPQAVNPPAAK
jgi:hypothetical protein